MTDNNQESKNNLIDLQRERQRKEARNAVARAKKLTKTHKSPDRSSGAIRWYHYFQLIVFLSLVAWLMRSC